MYENYLSIIYNENDRPKTSYPIKLCKFLFEKFNFKEGMSLLEIGCGRCETLNKFKELKLNVTGLDVSKEATSFSDGVAVKICNIDDPLSGLKGINIHKLISDDEIITPFSKSGTSIILHCLIKKLQVEKVNIKTNKRFGRSRYGSVFSSNWKILMSILPFISKYKKYETKKN